MVQTKLVSSKDQPALKIDLDTLLRLAREHADAQRDWSEAFIMHKMSDPKMTDNLARAKADIDVDLTGARNQYEVMLMVAQQVGVISTAMLGDTGA